MTVSLLHAFTSPVIDAGNPEEVGPNEWNAEHVLTQADARLLGRNEGTDGATRELTPTEAKTLLAISQSDVSGLVAALAALQPLDSDLTAIAALATTSYGRSLLTLANTAALAAELSSAYQPLDADLTAIAALTTTAYGRAFLALADAAAARTALALGTSAIVDTGTSGTKVALTDGANTWSATQSFTVAPLPTSNDGAALGSTSYKWSDVWLASGAVVNFDSGNVTITHAAGQLTQTGLVVFNTGTATSGLNMMRFVKTRSSSYAGAFRFEDIGGLTGDSGGGAFWRGLLTLGPGYTNPSGGANVFPISSFYWEFNTLSAPSTRNFVWDAGNIAAGAEPNFVIRIKNATQVTIKHSSAGVDFVGPITIGVYTVATLPTGASGMQAFASNLRVFDGAGVQEGAGAGTGGLCTHNGTAWKIAGTNITAVA